MDENTSTYDVKAIQEQIRKTRHKAELPLRIFGYIVTVLVSIIAGIFGYVIKNYPDVYQATTDALIEEGAEDGVQIVDILKVVGLPSCILLLIAIAVLVLFVFYRSYSDQMAYSVKVTDKNYPELHARAVEFAQKLNLKKVPDVYIQQQNGTLNAFSSMVPFRRYVQMSAEIVDIAYMENKDMDTVAFVMAHEFGHIYLHHTSFWHNLFFLVFRLIPILGPLGSRAMEYSADRVAQVITDNAGAQECMLMLAAGRHLYKYADMDDYLASVNGSYNFLERLSRFIVNLLANHPIYPFRVQAIMDPERKSGRLL